MSELSKQIRSKVKSGTSIPALVVDVFYNKASVRLSGNGSLIRRLSVIGGPVKKGDTVRVDFTTPEPTVVAIGDVGLTLADVKAAEKDMGWLGLTTITICLFSGGALRNMYPSVADGLATAILDSVDGDLILLPDVDITGDFAILPGTNLVGMSSRESIIRGTVTIEPGCLLESLTVLKQENSGSTISAVVVKETIASDELSRIKNCEIMCYSCGAGTAQGVFIYDIEVNLYVMKSTIIADSVSGLGYAFSNAVHGNVRVTHTDYYAKTEPFYEPESS